jgi:CheY-like chemotaxis protein
VPGETKEPISPLHILVAEDLDADAQLLKRAFLRAGIDVPLRFVTDGQQAIDYLKGTGAFANRTSHPLPTMLLLDLKMPLLSGFDVLEWVRLQPGLRRLLVVVFTSSDMAEDIDLAYELGANSYLVKPSGLNNLEETVRGLETYWLKLNHFNDCKPRPLHRRQPLRVLLRNTETGKFFASGRKWTDDPDEAMNFERTERAVQCAIALDVTETEVIVKTIRSFRGSL